MNEKCSDSSLGLSAFCLTDRSGKFIINEKKEVNMSTITNQIDAAEKEAVMLNSFANALLKAAESNNQQERLLAIDHNLKLWVEIETSLKSAKNLLPDDVKKNLFKLADFVKYMTMSKGINMTKEDFKSLANINNQISLGIQESVKNSLAAEEAFSLLKCAMDLSKAKEKSNAGELARALDNNMQLWVYIKTLARSKKNKMPEEIKGNLIKLADYVSKKTIEVGKNINNVNVKALDSMIDTNLQISEGLMNKQMQGLKK